MMIDVTIAAGFDGTFAQVFAQMNPLAAGAEMLWHSPQRAVFRDGAGVRIVVTGHGLTWARDGGEAVLTGGDVEALIWRKGGQDLVTFAALQTTGDLLWAAFAAGRDGSDPGALTFILTRHCWTCQGNAAADLFPEDAALTAGYDLQGNDRIMLYGGDDVFFTGAGRDTVRGDAGHDTLSGGADHDLLLGGGGDDDLIGGDGDDRVEGGQGLDSLAGGAGTDRLSGGLGRDRVEGGSGDDVLAGGAQADVFVFGPGSGVDVVTDYAVGVDHLQIDGPGRWEIVDAAAGAEVHFGRNILILPGVEAASLGAADFL